MSKAIRVFTICHSDDDHNDKNHRRVRVELQKSDVGYQWYADNGETDCGIGKFQTVADAEDAALHVWGSEVWAMKASWIGQ
jgi:hypothetical protein